MHENYFFGLFGYKNIKTNDLDQTIIFEDCVVTKDTITSHESLVVGKKYDRIYLDLRNFSFRFVSDSGVKTIPQKELSKFLILEKTDEDVIFG